MPRKASIQIPSSRTSAIEQQNSFVEGANSLLPLESFDLDSANLSELKEIIEQSHQAYLSNSKEALKAAIVAGKALLQAKEKFLYQRDQGGFQGWLGQLELSRASAYRYIAIAKFPQIAEEASTLTEALSLIQSMKSVSSRTEKTNIRLVLNLKPDRTTKLQAIAKEKEMEVADLVTQIVENWLKRQPSSSEVTIDV
ncbi:MAG: hypothetical protein HC894_32230 [Microcoleus sp. SM1_3_4]|nr:hypothetical protein [Microcoleus sp. SM1_3_4]